VVVIQKGYFVDIVINRKEKNSAVTNARKREIQDQFVKITTKHIHSLGIAIGG
jgi:hypothetical protein